jgi:hypothetical protein
MRTCDGCGKPAADSCPHCKADSCRHCAPICEHDQRKPVEAPLLLSNVIRDLACCDKFVRSSASEFCDECGYTNLDHLRKRSSQGKEVGR